MLLLATGEQKCFISFHHLTQIVRFPKPWQNSLMWEFINSVLSALCQLHNTNKKWINSPGIVWLACMNPFHSQHRDWSRDTPVSLWKHLEDFWGLFSLNRMISPFQIVHVSLVYCCVQWLALTEGGHPALRFSGGFLCARSWRLLQVHFGSACRTVRSDSIMLHMSSAHWL